MRCISAFLLAAGLIAAMAGPASAQIPFSATEMGRPIEDANLTMFSLTLPGEIGDLTSLELDISGLSHTNPDDLEFYLIKPTVGAITVLQDQGDGIEINGVDLTFADTASAAAPFGSELFAGTYLPLSAPGEGFNKFVDGSTAGAGLWTLVVIDDSVNDTGSFDSFTLRGTYVPEPVTMSLLALGAVATLRRKRR